MYFKLYILEFERKKPPVEFTRDLELTLEILGFGILKAYTRYF